MLNSISFGTVTVHRLSYVLLLPTTFTNDISNINTNAVTIVFSFSPIFACTKAGVIIRALSYLRTEEGLNPKKN